MEKKFKLGVIGAGFMSNAILKGVLKSNILSKNQIIVSDINAKSLENVNNLLGVNITNDNVFLANNSEFILFAIKPQNCFDVLSQISSCTCKKFISIMAGVNKAKIKQFFNNVLVARCMPNTPCSIGCGAVGIDLSDFVETSNIDDVNFIKGIFESIATVVVLSEKKLNIVTGISGSAPAYFYLFLKSIIDVGVENGLTYQQACALATNTMIGAGKMILDNSDKTIDQLISAVCSKGGTTIEAVNVFNENKLNDITNKAIAACLKRAKELEEIL